MSLPRAILYHGKDGLPPETIELRAGPLSLAYQGGDLKSIRLGDREILRRIYVAIRDRNWGTVLPQFSNLQMDLSGDAFRISYDAENKRGDIDFTWKGMIAGDREGTITFCMDGAARSDFLKNRIGFSILHPIKECAGQGCTIEKVDGSIVHGMFPRQIAPHQPFMDMRAIRHEVLPGLLAEVRFEGDTFEMEDQRNWTDASYKTYCTPLGLPFPVELKAGTKVSQTVTVALKGSIPALRVEVNEKPILIVGAGIAPHPMPRIGLGMASHNASLSPTAVTRLRALNLSYMLVEIRLSQPGYESRLQRAALESCRLKIPLLIAVLVSDNAEQELEALRATVDLVQPDLLAWLIFHSSEKSRAERWVKLAKQHLGDYDCKAMIGAGTSVYFTELNRNRPPFGVLDLVNYSITPQIHAFDNASLIETHEGQAATVESAQGFVAGRPLSISPVTLKPRFNPDATSPELKPRPGELPPQVDVRQMSLLGAGWTAGSIKYLSESKCGCGKGVYNITFYETTGWRGVMELDGGSPLPDKFKSLPGAVFPLYHVLADVGEFAGGGIVLSNSSAPGKVEALVIQKGERIRALLSNLGPKPQVVRVMDIGLTGSVNVKHLDETNAEAAMENPESFRADPGVLVQVGEAGLELNLIPYGLARVDSILGRPGLSNP